MPKSTRKRKDKSDGKYTKPNSFILPCLCTFWHAIPTSLFSFNDFLLSLGGKEGGGEGRGGKEGGGGGGGGLGGSYTNV